jgi:SAM-dependent methyltransferase
MTSASFETISIIEFQEILGLTLNEELRELFVQSDFSHQVLNEIERTKVLAEVKEVLQGELKSSGKHRKQEWEQGWHENYLRLQEMSNVDALIPGYFGKYPLLRWKQNWIKPQSKEMESNFLKIMIKSLATKYFDGVQSIYEFGCGTGHNLIDIAKSLPGKAYFGLDWAISSQDILRKVSQQLPEMKLGWRNFDFFEPDDSLMLNSNSGVITVAALEQVGSSHKDFVQFLLRNKPSIVLNIEPISELLDASNALDSISIDYFKKRNYLDGYLSYLRQLESLGEVRICEAKRSYFGSLFIEGYSIIVWSPEFK